jgi:hypothetical protein
MHCLSCHGPLEYAQDVKYARCTHCLALFDVRSPKHGGRFVEPMNVAAADVERVAAELGFAPRQRAHTVVGVGGVNLKVNTGKMERDLKTKVSSYLWGLAFGGVVLVLLAVVFIVVIVFALRGSGSSTPSASSKSPKNASWDGKGPLTCGVGESLRVSKVTSALSSGSAIKASGNCVLEIVDSNISAPVGVEASANAKVSIRGGAIEGASSAVVASGNATVDIDGARVKGSVKKTGNAKVTGAN